MIGKHIFLTLLVGAGVCTLLWQRPPEAWTSLRIVGMVLIIAARQLVTRGLYSRIRNPIYVFGSWVLAGAILVFGKPVWLLIFFPLIPLQIWRARKESVVLEAAFGEEYRKYRAGTWF